MSKYSNLNTHQAPKPQIQNSAYKSFPLWLCGQDSVWTLREALLHHYPSSWQEPTQAIWFCLSYWNSALKPLLPLAKSDLVVWALPHWRFTKASSNLSLDNPQLPLSALTAPSKHTGAGIVGRTNQPSEWRSLWGQSLLLHNSYTSHFNSRKKKKNTVLS